VSAFLPSLGPAELHSARPRSTSGQELKLQRAAGDFESILLASFWKSMKESFGSPEDESSDPAHETLDDWGIQAMSDAVGKAGGLGIGKLILKHLEPQIAVHVQAKEAKSQ